MPTTACKLSVPCVVHPRLLSPYRHLQSFVFGRLCLDDANPSVAAAALNATEAFLAPLARDGEEEEAAMQGLSWVDYQVRGLGVARAYCALCGCRVRLL